MSQQPADKPGRAGTPTEGEQRLAKHILECLGGYADDADDFYGDHKYLAESLAFVREEAMKSTAAVPECGTITCEKCAFRYGAEHTLADGTYKCPVCELSEIRSARPLSRNYQCGCVLCICDDEVRCHGCGAKSCGKSDAECDFKQAAIRRALVSTSGTLNAAPQMSEAARPGVQAVNLSNPSAGAAPLIQDALDRASWELQRFFGREGSIYGIKACEEIARIAIVAYGAVSATQERPK